MINVKGRILGLLIAASLIASPAAAQTMTPVDLELSLLVDVSGSVNASEFALQRDGYEAAFRSTAVHDAISAGAIGSIAVNFIYWAGSDAQQQVVGWTLINSVATANLFADAIAAAARPVFASVQTAIGSAIEFAYPLFATNDYDGTRQVIDVSGDGQDNVPNAFDAGSSDPVTARGNAVAAGVDAINGLAILVSPTSTLDEYYEMNVATDNGFVIAATGFSDFQNAVSRKLEREIRNPPPPQVPEPMTVTLLATGILGIAVFARRREEDVE